MKTAVVILNWNGAEMMRKFLPSVVKHSQEADVVVADNGSTDESLQLLAQDFPTVKTIALKQNYGFAEGYNKAIELLTGCDNKETNCDNKETNCDNKEKEQLTGYEYIVLLNSDVEVSDGWLAPLVAFMDNHAEAAACQPKLLAYNDKESFEYAGAAGGFIDMYGYPFCRGRVFATVEKDQGQYDTVQELHWATGACLMIRTKDYIEAGGLDDRFFAHNEEIDLCWRLRIFGRKIYCVPESKVWHLGGGTLPQGNPRKTYLNFRNNLTMLYKNLPEQSLKKVLLMRYWLDRLAMLQSLLKGNIADVKAIMKARKDFSAWKQDYKTVRQEIQQKRQLSPQKDLTNYSILWQYYARGKKIFYQR